METVVVTRHPALVDLLIERGIIDREAPVLSQVTAEDIAGRHVIGVLPLSLAAHAARVTEVPITYPRDGALRGQELSLEQLRNMAGPAITYRVEVLS